MIGVFAPRKAVLLTLFSVMAIKLAGANLTIAVSMFLFFLGMNGLSSCSVIDVDRLYHPKRDLPSGKIGLLDSFRISLLLLLFSILSSLYSESLVAMVALVLVGISSAAIRMNHTFLSVLLEALTFFFAMMVPAFTTARFIYNFPLAWVVGLSFLLINLSTALERPYGFENLNLPKIVGVENTKYIFAMVAFLNAMWGMAPIVLMSLGYTLIYPFALSALAIATYLTLTDRHKEAGKALIVSTLLYLVSLVTL
ncbi:MAG: hypothetical protein GOV00_02405 [Candidatus Altiarchaeota archaeon]|nr:hypothetical protein [Candidatus Altiarchaeota archaeon]